MNEGKNERDKFDHRHYLYAAIAFFLLFLAALGLKAVADTSRYYTALQVASGVFILLGAYHMIMVPVKMRRSGERRPLAKKTRIIAIPTKNYHEDLEAASGIIRSFWAEKRFTANQIAGDVLQAGIADEDGNHLGSILVAQGECDCSECKHSYVIVHYNLPQEIVNELFGNLRNRFEEAVCQ